MRISYSFYDRNVVYSKLINYCNFNVVTVYWWKPTQRGLYSGRAEGLTVRGLRARQGQKIYFSTTFREGLGPNNHIRSGYRNYFL